MYGRIITTLSVLATLALVIVGNMPAHAASQFIF